MDYSGVLITLFYESSVDVNLELLNLLLFFLYWNMEVCKFAKLTSFPKNYFLISTKLSVFKSSADSL